MTNCKIIAEAGINHNGRFSTALKLVDKAKKIGADFIKFQIYKTENLTIKKAKLADYQSVNTKKTNQYDLLKLNELTFEQHGKIANYCKKKNINYMASAFDLESLHFYSKLNKKIIKIPSGEINNFIYLKSVKDLGFKNIIFSTGMASMKEIIETYKFLNSKNRNVFVMHCTSEYPAKNKNLNLNFLKSLSKNFKGQIGYSDHSLSIFTPSLAVALGAMYIEKHFTLDNKMIGPDHKASLNVVRFKNMINQLKQTEASLGKNKKIISKEESKNKKVVRKSIVANNYLKNGKKIKFSDLDFKRPGIGISPGNYKKLIGKELKKNLNKNEIIYLRYIK